jgi:predicted ATPase
MFRRRQRAPQPITIGSVLDNRYRLQEQLGAGGAGVIYKAEDEQLKRTVAIKILLGGGMDGSKLERFRGEARSVARLNHPNIITLHDYAEEQGQPYLVIEYIPGEDLWELDNNYAPDLMPIEEALPIIDGILAALEYSHAHQVIHRDLKPENIMITPEGQVKVMDFGLARIEGQSRLTQDGLVAGTAAYLAPELALGEAGDHRVDLYAVGVIIYELLTGRRPFSGDDPLAVVSQHVHARVVPPRHYNPAIPDDLQTIILKLLAKKPNDRYSDTTEVRQELASILIRLRSGTLDEPAGSGQKEGLAADTSADSRALLKRIAQGKLVGRENVLGKLKLRWDKIRLGEYKAEPLLLISGEGGIGKTRLLRELQVYTGLRDGYILHGVAEERDVGTPYAIFANMLSNYISEQPAEVLRSQMSGFIAGEVVKVVPQLTEKLGSIQPNPPLEPSAERARLLNQISKFLLKVAHEQPTLLLLDDLQFADPGSLTILEMLLRQAVGTSMLVTGAYRNVGLSYSNPINRFITSLEASGLIYQIALRRLSQSAVKQLLEALLGNTVRRKFVRSIYQVTEGNPLFVEELIKSLVVDRQIILRDNRWEQQRASLVQIPGSIRAVLGKRLDHIENQTVELLRLASIIGRSFALDLLTEASPYEDDVVQSAIDEALGAQLIEVARGGDQLSDSAGVGPVVHYQFQHALIRETLLADEELRPLRRRRLHRRVAAALEKLIGDEPIKNPATLARHFIAGAQDEKAVPYLRHAGGKAHKFYVNEEALDYLSQAYEILEDITPDLTGPEQEANLRERLDLLSQQRDIVDMMGARDREFAILKVMQALVETLADKEQWAEVMSQFSTYYWHIGKLAEAEDTARQAQKVARENRNKSGELHALEQIARVLLSRRDSQSMEYATQALALARQSEDRILEGRLKALIGQIYTNTLYDPEQAAINFERALEICRENNNRYEEAWTLWGMGGLAMLVGDYTGALQRYTDARKISEDIGSSLQAGWDLYNMGNAWYNLGANEQALDCFQQAQDIFKTAQHPRGIIEVLISLGLIYLATRKPDKADSYFEQAVRQAEEREDLHLMLRSYQALSTYYRLMEGDDSLTNAVRLSNRVIKLAAEGGYFEHELIGHFLRGANFFEMRNLQQALESSQQAIVQLEQSIYISSPQIPVTEIYYTHSRILAALGQVDTAQSYLRKAHDETLRRANLIADEQQRLDFLNNVSLNQEIMATSQELL